MRGFIAGVLVVIGLVLVPLGVIGVWMERRVLPSDAFADLALEVLREEPVTEAFANRFLDELEQRVPQLSAGRFVLEPAVKQAIGTSQFETVFGLSVRDMHEQLIQGDNELTLNLDAMLPIVRDLVAQVSSDVADQIPSSVGLSAITVVREDQVPQLWLGVKVTRQAAWIFPLLMLVAFVGAVLVASKREYVLMVCGFGTAFVCLVMGLVLRTGRDFLSDYVGSVVDLRAFNAGYDVVVGSVIGQALLIGIVGLLAGVGGVVWLVVKRTNAKPPAWA